MNLSTNADIIAIRREKLLKFFLNIFLNERCFRGRPKKIIVGSNNFFFSFVVGPKKISEGETQAFSGPKKNRGKQKELVGK